MDYRWLNSSNPDESESFKWNFMRDMVKPQLDIQGPSVGSLLYALNPETSELGLKQMDSELNQQLAANESFDKKGQDALKFMEDRVQEDIKRKQLGNVDAGHANSMIGNLINAYQSGNKTAIAIAEEQVKKSIPNSDGVIAQAQQQATLGLKQKQNGFNLDSLIPRGNGWTSPQEREKYKATVDSSFANGEIDEKTHSELIKNANGLFDQATQRSNTVRTAMNTRAANKTVAQANVEDWKSWYEKNKSKYRSLQAARDDYKEIFGVEAP